MIYNMELWEFNRLKLGFVVENTTYFCEKVLKYKHKCDILRTVQANTQTRTTKKQINNIKMRKRNYVNSTGEKVISSHKLHS